MEAYLIYKISPYPSLPKRGIWIGFSNSGKYWGNSPIKGEGNMENVSLMERGIWIISSMWKGRDILSSA